MRKNTDNKGFSLVELIVTITVMTVLVGMFVPRFTVYLNARRQQTCRANREALLNIYEKAVYDDQLLVEQADLQMVVDASGAKMTTEYTNQARDYLICPDAKEVGHYTAHVNDNVAYITCDCHTDDVCTLTFDNWVEKADISDPSIDLDPAYDIPAAPVDETEGSSDPEEEEVPPADMTETVNTGIWPRVMDQQGRLDERWAEAGAKPGSTVTINGPVHFIDITGAEIVVVKGPYVVKYEDANYPLGHGANALPGVVAASGVKYTESNMPVQVEVQEQGHYEYTPRYKTVSYKGETRETVEYVLQDCKRVDCPDRYTKEHHHEWMRYGDDWPNNTNIFKTTDCKVEGCKDRKKRKHDHDWEQFKYVQQKVKKYVGPDCKVEGCKDRYVKDHTHQVLDGQDQKWVPGDINLVYRVNYGDMIEMNGVTYICSINSGSGNYVEKLPTASQTSMGVDYNGWYVVPALTANK